MRRGMCDVGGCECGIEKMNKIAGMHVHVADSHSNLKVKYSVKCRHSWFPLSINRVLG